MMFPAGDNVHQICCGGCAFVYGIENYGGIDVRFDKPFDDVAGKVNHVVETSEGLVHIRLNMENVELPKKSYPCPPTKIQHYYCSAIINGDTHATVGIVLFSDRAKAQALPSQAPIYKKTQEDLEKKLEGILAFKSELCYNSFIFHKQEGEKNGPYLTVYIFDKGMKK